MSLRDVAPLSCDGDDSVRVCVCVRPSHVDAGRWCDGGSRHDRVESRESNHGREQISTWSYPLDVPISAETHSTPCEATSVDIHFDVTPAYARSIPQYRTHMNGWRISKSPSLRVACLIHPRRAS